MPNDLKRNDPASSALERWRLVALLTALAAALVVVPAPWRALAPAARTAGPSSSSPWRAAAPVLEHALVAASSVAVWLLLGWVVLVALLTALARMPGAGGDWARRRLRALTPALVRRTLLAGLGVGAVLGVAAGPAVTAGVAAGSPADATASVSTASGAGMALPRALTWTATDRVAQAIATTAVGLDEVPPVVHCQLPGDDLLLRAAAPRPDSGWQVHRPAGVLVVGARGSLPGTAADVDLDWPVDPPAERPAAPPRAAAAEPVVVVRGDTLWSIAARALGPGADQAAIDAAWHRWYAANRAVIGDDPDLLLPGQRLVPPDPPAART